MGARLAELRSALLAGESACPTSIETWAPSVMAQGLGRLDAQSAASGNANGEADDYQKRDDGCEIGDGIRRSQAGEVVAKHCGNGSRAEDSECYAENNRSGKRP